MMAVLPPTLRGVLAALVVSLSLMVLFTGFLPGAVAKLLVPHAGFRRACVAYMLWFCRAWVRTITWTTDYISCQPVVVDIDIPPDTDGRYLLIGNHQSWADIPVLIRALDRTLPFPRWFIKRQMLWVPFIGFATWALDFPYMRRYTRNQIERNPALAGRDLDTTRRACEIYRHQSVTVVNYAEGTRSTPAKRASRQSPYRTMLRPKAGGTAFMLNAMGDVLDGVVELMITYPGVDRPSAWDYACGRMPPVHAVLRRLDIPEALRRGDYENDPDYAERFRAWLNELWAARDAEITQRMADTDGRETN
ncbi:MAG: acetyltransferase [Salinisphaeraceae bacterium]